MGMSSTRQSTRYYDFYRDKEIVFTKANLKSLKMDPRQIYVKCNGGQWPCIINSSSLMEAKVLLGKSSGAYEIIQKTPNTPFSLRYCFFDDNNEAIQFFVNCNVLNVETYQDSTELVLVTFKFSARPPEELILRLGEFIEVNENFETRKEERIALNTNSMRFLGIPKEESYVFIAGVPRKCIMKDLSFSGARVMLVGIPKFLINKTVDLRIIFTDTNEKISLIGIVKAADFFPGRKDIAIIHIVYDVEQIPISYKFHINSYITSYQKKRIENQITNNVANQNNEVEDDEEYITSNNII